MLLMTVEQPTFMQNCLYFTANRLMRDLEQLAATCFAPTNLAPTYTYLVLMIEANPGISMTELASAFDYEQSTLSRLIRKIATRGWLRKQRQGHQTRLYLTATAGQIVPTMQQALADFRDRSDQLMGGRPEKLKVAHAMVQASQRAKAVAYD
ncbi:MarR family transcriptional regulator [Loigolactobacillus coryniformis subsp. coryniformis KCTC 3167 = DSM 20001]|uniref:MarR family transcriptional regulator n=2 Tax=Loigolactobacillus coryniformis TaxID=1610 RepID=A0A0R1FAG7_9LACO|nr:MarR family transcriptional regulator [Loigolactobacillus coryniformis subsp. coryniformis KCTC 3167 = DSM 20001]